MKKQVLVTIISMIPAMSFAKIADFNAIIADNVKSSEWTSLDNEAQYGWHSSGCECARTHCCGWKFRHDVQFAHKQRPFGFQKEKVSFKASEEKQFDRLASEVSESDSSF